MQAKLGERNTEIGMLTAKTGEDKAEVKNECNASRPWLTLMFWLQNMIPYIIYSKKYRHE